MPKPLSFLSLRPAPNGGRYHGPNSCGPLAENLYLKGQDNGKGKGKGPGDEGKGKGPADKGKGKGPVDKGKGKGKVVGEKGNGKNNGEKGKGKDKVILDRPNPDPADSTLPPNARMPRVSTRCLRRSPHPVSESATLVETREISASASTAWSLLPCPWLGLGSIPAPQPEVTGEPEEVE